MKVRSITKVLPMYSVLTDNLDAIDEDKSNNENEFDSDIIDFFLFFF